MSSQSSPGWTLARHASYKAEREALFAQWPDMRGAVLEIEENWERAGRVPDEFPKHDQIRCCPVDQLLGSWSVFAFFADVGSNTLVALHLVHQRRRHPSPASWATAEQRFNKIQGIILTT
jgi:hypothetical protein